MAEQVTAGRKNNTGTFDWANMDKVVKEARSSVGQVSQKQKTKERKRKENQVTKIIIIKQTELKVRVSFVTSN